MPIDGAAPGARTDWGDLQFFAAVARSGSIAGAARALAVNHSTVLRRIAALEESLGSRLFDRLPGGYALTASGNALAEHLGAVSDQIDAAQRHLMGLDEEIKGPIKLTSSDVVVESLLMPLLARFLRLHPRVRIQLVTGYPFTGLSREEADLAVRGAASAPGPLIARRAGDIETVLCASRAYVARVGVGVALTAHRWVAVDESLSFSMFERWLREHVPVERVAARVDSLVGVADAVAAGLGVGMLPRPLVAARPELVQLAPAEPQLNKPVWILMHPEVHHMARVRALADFLFEHLGADPLLAH
jgi:molybdate transport repressor ModE-like protein